MTNGNSKVEAHGGRGSTKPKVKEDVEYKNKKNNEPMSERAVVCRSYRWFP